MSVNKPVYSILNMLKITVINIPLIFDTTNRTGQGEIDNRIWATLLPTLFCVPVLSPAGAWT